jgi:hypothetical protein
MNAIAFAAMGGTAFDEASTPLDAAWLVLEAANDLGDHATVESCRRVIDANLNGTSASPSDIHVVIDYFR